MTYFKTLLFYFRIPLLSPLMTIASTIVAADEMFFLQQPELVERSLHLPDVLKRETGSLLLHLSSNLSIRNEI
ncbi:hypothetical protein V8F20_000307 [Naviculisporaceae sp. PSN 640]